VGENQVGYLTHEKAKSQWDGLPMLWKEIGGCGFDERARLGDLCETGDEDGQED
jgi:hypothetical protein